ncbi:hypothetical protein ABID16_000001 [Rhizobium aquaticum]|uniref:Uncharacterized protein n=1 Tax=Rhizobium aquaticum TaxID=1549636 RepID=A0ABV2IUA2_9HYPH
MDSDSELAKSQGKQVTVRFQIWLTTLATVLNVCSTAAAVAGIFFASQQVHAALESVDKSSRNQAFSNFLETYQNLCQQSITMYDQMDGIVLNLPDDGSITLPDNFDATILTAPYEAVLSLVTTDKRNTYAQETVRLRAKLENQYKLLTVWLTQHQSEEFFGLIPSRESSDYRTSTSGPPTDYDVFQAIDNQYRCRRNMEGALSYFRRMSDPTSVADKDPGIFMLPISKTKSVKAILAEWGDTVILDYLKTSGVLEYVDVQGKE